ncbi:alpha/beta hydrolase [Streptomyces sp. NPDC050548]|uniref:alpha/beta hydrolase n=1 Tax=Streptomyces sp. NPDC050548 TaxID=3365629 RepID=UPI0037B519BE
MGASASIQPTKVTFPNQYSSMAGNLFSPPNMEKTKTYPALVVVHPFGGVKEQTAGIYAKKMADRGYVTLAFDASHQGESGGYPRDTENPAERMEDIRCAIDYLATLPAVNEDRIGILGICAGGSYALGVAPTEMRAKAIASVSLWDLGVTAREGWPSPQYDRTTALVEIGRQRTAEARGETIRRDASFLKEMPKDLPQVIEESYDYYRTPRAQHPNSRSVFVFTDYARLMDFNYYSQIERIAPRPVLFVVGTEAATIFMSNAGYEKAAQPKEWFEVPGATHHRLYDDEAAVEKAVAKLEEFFGRHL